MRDQLALETWLQIRFAVRGLEHPDESLGTYPLGGGAVPTQWSLGWLDCTGRALAGAPNLATRGNNPQVFAPSLLPRLSPTQAHPRWALPSSRGETMRAMTIAVLLCLSVGGCAPKAEQRLHQTWAQRQLGRLSVAETIYFRRTGSSTSSLSRGAAN